MKISLFWKPIIWLALICYGLFLPANDLPLKSFLKIPYFDKMVHFGLFFVLCLLLLRPFKRLNMNHLLIAPAISITLGAVLETIQHMLSHSRSSNIYDFLANTTGILVAVVFFHYFISGKKWESVF